MHPIAALQPVMAANSSFSISVLGTLSNCNPHIDPSPTSAMPYLKAGHLNQFIWQSLIPLLKFVCFRLIQSIIFNHFYHILKKVAELQNVKNNNFIIYFSGHKIHIRVLPSNSHFQPSCQSALVILSKAKPRCI